MSRPSADDVATEESEPEPEPEAMRLDVDPADRVWDRMMATLGLLDDAAPLFANAKAVPAAGVLCALPLLVPSGFDEGATR